MSVEMTRLQQVQSYEEAVSYILEMPKFTKKNTIEQTKAFYAYIKEPGSRAKVVHVAGTNGKGSVCAYLQSVLMEAKIATGMFTSPHLVNIRERLQYWNEMISEEEFIRVFQILQSDIISYNEKFCMSQNNNLFYHPTFFEWLFLMAMMWFEEKGAEVIILETGLGGRLDTTNVIKQPAVSAIAKIGYDHMEYLGHTIEEIAGEKAGIIKEDTPVLFIEQKRAVEAVLEAQAEKIGTSSRKVSKIKETLIRVHEKDIDFSMESRYYGNIQVGLHTKARYQVENASLAVAIVEELFQGKRITIEEIQNGMRQAYWPGRMEEIFPNVFLDGAHNEDGIEAFLESVVRDHCEGKRFILFSAVADKEYETMSRMILNTKLFEKVGTAPIENSRSLTIEQLKQVYAENADIDIFISAIQGMQHFMQQKQKVDKVYIVGSLYLVGQIKEFIEKVMVNK